MVGGVEGKPMHFRKGSMTARSVITEMIFESPPHLGQQRASMRKTRLSNSAHGKDGRGLPEAAVTSSMGGRGTIWLRRRAFGASTPWYRMSFLRG